MTNACVRRLFSCLALFFAAGIVAERAIAEPEPSICYGSTSDGRLDKGVNLPAAGDNFVTYSRLARVAGRTYVHSAVRDIIVAAYRDLATSNPGKVYKYAETGFKNGGRFKPHKTHTNGLSVDFMTPVINAQGESVHLPTNALNRLGYDIEFDADGRFEDLTIDYTAMAAHIVALHQQAVAHGHDLWRVIFDPDLQPNLMATEYGDYLSQHIEFSKTRSWVRHDEHYHVDFAVACQ
jgi:penicillin-insensitive murein endopeptidase